MTENDQDNLQCRLSRFLDGQMPQGERQELLDRLETDGDARQMLEEMEQVERLAQSALRSALDAPLPRRIANRAVYAAAAGLAAAAIVAATVLLSILHRPADAPGPGNQACVAGRESVGPEMPRPAMVNEIADAIIAAPAGSLVPKRMNTTESTRIIALPSEDGDKVTLIRMDVEEIAITQDLAQL